MRNANPAGATHLTRRTVLAAAAAGTAAASLGAPPAEAATTLRLSTDGVTRYKIVVAASASAPVQTAAKELSHWLNQATGATFPVIDSATVASSDQVIAIGQDLPARLASKTKSGRRAIPLASGRVDAKDSFSLRVVDTNLVIAGQNDAGTLHGVSWFLTNLVGIEWYGPDVTEIPHRPTLTISDDRLNSDQSPWLVHRSVLSKEATNTAWGHRNLLTMRPVVDGSAFQPEPGWAAGSFWWPGIHPGQFKQVITDQTLWVSGQVLCMDPRTVTAAVSTLQPQIQTRINAWGDASHPFHINDAAWGVPDVASAGFAAEHGNTLAAPVLHLVNETARTLKTHLPTARLETQAYLFTQRPPTGLAVEDNVVITYAPIWATMAQSLWSGSNAAQGEGTQLDGWRGLTSEILLWDYGYSTTDMFFLCGDYWSHAETLQHAAQSDTIKGYLLESSYSLAGNENSALKGWLLGKVLWDPDRDIDALIRQHCDGYYGAAGPLIYQILRSIADDGATTFFRMGCTTASTVRTPYLGWRTVREAQTTLAQAASSVAGNAIHAAHVRDLQMAIDHWTIIHRSTYQADSAAAGDPWVIDHTATVNRQMANWAASGRTQWRYTPAPGDLASLQALYELQGKRIAPAPPAELAGVPAEDYRIFDDGVLAQGERGFDPLASDHLAATMPGHESWLVQLRLTNLPTDGRWKLHFRVRMELVEGTDLSQQHFEIGCYPSLPGDSSAELSTTQQYPLSMFASGDYVTVTAFDDWAYDASGRYLYLTGLGGNPAANPPGIATIKKIYVDRAWAVRV